MSHEKGSSLMELMAATFLFMILLYSGYECFGRQIRWSSLVLNHTRPEAESNYRIVLLKQLLENASQRLKYEPLLQPAELFVPGIPDSDTPPETAFSVCYTQGLGSHFLKQENDFRVFSESSWEDAKYCLLGGATQNGDYAWNYARIEAARRSGDETLLKLEFLLAKPNPERGRITEVQVYTFLYRSETLYWVNPSGQLQPFFDHVQQFQYRWNPPVLSIFWQAGEISAEFKTRL